MITLSLTQEQVEILLSESKAFRNIMASELESVEKIKTQSDFHLINLVRNAYVTSNGSLISSIKALREYVGTSHTLSGLAVAKEFIVANVSDLKVKFEN